MTHAAPIWYGILDAQTVGGGGGGGGSTDPFPKTASSGGANHAYKITDLILTDWAGLFFYIEDGNGWSGSAGGSTTIDIDGTTSGSGADAAYYRTATTGGRGGGFPTDDMRGLGCIDNNGNSGSSYEWNFHSLSYNFGYGSTAAFSTSTNTNQCRTSTSAPIFFLTITFGSGRGGYIPPLAGDSMDWDMKVSVDGGSNYSQDYNAEVNWTNNTSDLP